MLVGFALVRGLLLSAKHLFLAARHAVGRSVNRDHHIGGLDHGGRRLAGRHHRRLSRAARPHAFRRRSGGGFGPARGRVVDRSRERVRQPDPHRRCHLPAQLRACRCFGWLAQSISRQQSHLILRSGAKRSVSKDGNAKNGAPAIMRCVGTVSVATKKGAGVAPR